MIMIMISIIIIVAINIIIIIITNNHSSSYHDHHYDEVNPVQVKNGFVDVPENPGLGVIPDVSIFGHPVFSV